MNTNREKMLRSVARCTFMGFVVFFFCGSLRCFAYAEEITLLYTGSTHSMLYTCSCPKEKDGGISRRASLIKELRKTNANTLVLDSGAFFGGGIKDEYTQNTELDKARTKVNLKAMAMMRYDAAALSPEEFNFGKDFLHENIAGQSIAFLSCNVSPDTVDTRPYVIKAFGDVKIGIIGVTSPLAEPKSGGLKFSEPKAAVKVAIQALKKESVSIVILLSNLGEQDDLELINSVPGIDVLVEAGTDQSKSAPAVKLGSTILLRPSWQARRLGKATLIIKDKKIIDFTTAELRLSDQVKDDPDIVTILPRCFSDAQCVKEGLIGVCDSPGSLKAQCVFTEASKVQLLVVTLKDCFACNTENVVNFLKKKFPGLTVSYLYYPETHASKLAKDLALEGLPAYLLGKEAETERSFEEIKSNAEFKGGYYVFKSYFTGVAYFQNRPKIPGKIDLFISLYDEFTFALLEEIKDLKPQVHFLAVKQGNKFDAAKGTLEVEDYLRGVCVQKYYPHLLWTYMSCRAASKESSWWDDCLSSIDIKKIKSCAQGQEGIALLSANISLAADLKIMRGPTYLMDNQEIFGTNGVPSKKELKKIFKR
ncbi:MAG: hypothetical protein WDL87_10495 [Candidatus Omnitrophota bacterium]|jgi:hypothetical protein